MRGAKNCNKYGRFLTRRVSPDTQPSLLLQAGNRHQNEETSDGGDVMNLESWKEVGAQREYRQRNNHPHESVLTQAPKEGDGNQVERRQKEEPIKTHAIFQPLEIAADGFLALMKRKLHFVIHGLLLRKLPMRDLWSLNSERRRHAILILAQHFGKSSPTACHQLILHQRQENRGKHHQSRDSHQLGDGTTHRRQEVKNHHDEQKNRLELSN